jgi:hypothetical protein
MSVKNYCIEFVFFFLNENKKGSRVENRTKQNEQKEQKKLIHYNNNNNNNRDIFQSNSIDR